MTQASDTIRVYIAEEQGILREVYLSSFASNPRIEVVESSGDTSAASIAEAVQSVEPDVVLIGGKVLKPDVVATLEKIREGLPEVALVVLSASHEVEGVRALREFSRGNSVGCAYLLKHTIDTADQIAQTIEFVADGRLIVDPVVMDGMISAGESATSFLGDLTRREVEVLSWMARGYKNDTIAEVLSLDTKTVERHINNVYSKLGDCPESMNPRVYAVMSYLSATGMLPPEQFGRDGRG